MNFTTPLHIEPSAQQLSYGQKIVSIGSCFSENIGQRLIEGKFECINNPFGIIFNPLSIAKLISSSIQSLQLEEAHFITADDYHFHFDLHSEIYSESKAQLDGQISQLQDQTRSRLQKADWLLVTFGTAVAYQYTKTGQIVANCHKVPAKEFSKEMLQADAIQLAWSQLIDELRAINPNLKLIFTLSPVRHTKDTLSVNSLSKAILRVACEQIGQAHAGVFYFPSYEIMMDELRDYRFYAKDMIHPSELAIDYIWERFLQTYLDKKSSELYSKWMDLRKALAHRPFREQSEGHRQFLATTLEKLEQLSDRLDLTQEIITLKKD